MDRLYGKFVLMFGVYIFWSWARYLPLSLALLLAAGLLAFSFYADAARGKRTPGYVMYAYLITIATCVLGLPLMSINGLLGVRYFSFGDIVLICYFGVTVITLAFWFVGTIGTGILAKTSAGQDLLRKDQDLIADFMPWIINPDSKSMREFGTEFVEEDQIEVIEEPQPEMPLCTCSNCGVAITPDDARCWHCNCEFVDEPPPPQGPYAPIDV